MAMRSSPSVRMRRLAAHLRELRESAGLTQEEVADRTGKDRSTLYRLENAQQRPQRSTLIQLLDLYGTVEPRRSELLTLLRESKQRGWVQKYRFELPEVYTDYIGFEEDARSLSSYESLFVPGLLQTDEYARAMLRGVLPDATEEDVEVRAATRLQRQAALAKEGAPKLWTIMDEAALHRIVGGRDVMREQIEQLQEMRTRPNVTIQVIPFEAGSHPGMDGSFVILDFPGEFDQGIVYVETAAGGLFLEEEAEVRRYLSMFEHLRAAALGLGATGAMLDAIRTEL
ncbi:MAG: helix-turn-helix domain-containing protein [Nocardiopsaceae bacterium]|nr:helix-turn-helix domain-containing protein [Nocardiopsaceae bacterium]